MLMFVFSKESGGLRMARLGRSSLFHAFAGMLLATLLLPEFLLAGPVIKRLKGDDGINEKSNVEAGSTRLIRNRRNISWYKQHSDFWSWYKYFTDNGNQEGVAELDRVYLAYLKNKNRAESRRSYKLYLQHLADIYKSCSETDDPNCVAAYTSRPTPKVEAPAPVKACDPRDPYCAYPKGYTYYPYLAPAPVKAAPAPAPVKGPAYLHSAVVKDPRSGQYYYSPLMQSFLSAEQKAELLRICDAEDVECLQYHLRAAYGYKPAAVLAPSYAHLGCDPKTDPYCAPQPVQKAPASLYTQYPYCDPRVDPYCTYPVAQSSPSALERPCNPLYDDNCNPLTAARFASLSIKGPRDEPASEAGAMRVPPSTRHDPYAMYRDASAAADMRRRLPTHLQPQRHQPEEPQSPLGPRGKTKEGYDCYIGYDEECFPLGNDPRTGAQRPAHLPSEAFEPHLNNDGSRNGVVEPDPDCDPEYDRNCRLRRYEPEGAEHASPSPQDEDHVAQPTQDHSDEQSNHEEFPQHREESYPETPGYDQQQYDPYMSGQEDPYAGYGPQEPGAPSFQDLMRGYGARYPGQDDHRAYTGDYKKK
ncbi:actinodin1 isoform X1 [Misgurnus anguillicaudatus]|uniref:actinodin1 isoform X1 n=2 Tax=Misgurnus anguillicaudatus TaxID=75329 RepID=UPI003CCFD50E